MIFPPISGTDLVKILLLVILAFSERKVSADGSVKYNFYTEDGIPFEAVYIFLMAGDIHFAFRFNQVVAWAANFAGLPGLAYQGNLELTQILNQLFSIEEKDLINHIVFMGMGEPMDNYENLLKCIEILTAEWGFGIALET